MEISKRGNVHRPVVSVPLAAGNSVEVRELTWPDAMHLYEVLAAQGKTFFNEEGNAVFSAERILNAVQQNIELGTWLVLKTTGKEQEWLNARSVSEVLDLVTEAAVLNIGIIIERIKNGRSRLQGLVVTTTKAPTGEPSERSTNDSSSKGT